MSPNSKNPAADGDRAPNSFCLAAELSENNQPAGRVQANVIGIDPGLVGALALVSRDGDLIEVADMPVLRDGSGERTAANAPLVAVLLARWHEGGHLRIRLCATQRRRCRSVRGRVRRPWASFAVPDASRVKRIVGIAAGRDGAKDAARSEAIRRWPDKASLFARVPRWQTRGGGIDRPGRAHAGARAMNARSYPEGFNERAERRYNADLPF